jgi:hypothetical protein
LCNEEVICDRTPKENSFHKNLLRHYYGAVQANASRKSSFKVALSRYIARNAKRPSARIRVSQGKTGVTTQPDHSDLMTGSVKRAS